MHHFKERKLILVFSIIYYIWNCTQEHKLKKNKANKKKIFASYNSKEYFYRIIMYKNYADKI